MPSITFQDYSDVLTPLPALPPDGTQPRTQLHDTSGSSFQDHLENLVNDPLTTELGPEVPVSTEPLFNYNPHVSGNLQFPGSVGISLDPVTGTTPDELEELMEVCRDIEGYLLSLLLKGLGKSFASSTLFSQTSESSFYKEMFFSEMAQSLGREGPGLGIAESIYNDIIIKQSMSIDQVI